MPMKIAILDTVSLYYRKSSVIRFPFNMINRNEGGKSFTNCCKWRLDR